MEGQASGWVYREVGEEKKRTLCGNHTPLPQRLIQQLEIRLLEQTLGRPIRITRVRNNHIVLILMILQILKPIAHNHIDLLMLKPHTHSRQEFLTIPNNRLINIHQRGLLDTLVLDNLSQHAAVTAADDEHALGVRVRKESQVRDHFLVAELVALGALDDVVKDEHDAVSCGFEDEYVLELGLLMVQDLVHFEGHGLAGPHVVDFAEPAIFDRWVCNFGHGEGGGDVRLVVVCRLSEGVVVVVWVGWKGPKLWLVAQQSVTEGCRMS